MLPGRRLGGPRDQWSLLRSVLEERCGRGRRLGSASEERRHQLRVRECSGRFAQVQDLEQPAHHLRSVHRL
jgi:hypothetical protein